MELTDIYIVTLIDPVEHDLCLKRIGGMKDHHYETIQNMLNINSCKQPKPINQIIDSQKTLKKFSITRKDNGQDMLLCSEYRKLLNEIDKQIKSNPDSCPSIQSLNGKYTFITYKIWDNQKYIKYVYYAKSKDMILQNCLAFKDTKRKRLKKSSDTNNYQLDIVDEILNLPTSSDKCLCSFDEETIYIYDSFSMNKYFNLEDTIKSEAKQNFEFFLNGNFKITNDEFKVCFNQNDKVLQKIQDEQILYQSFATYTNHKNRKINQIKIDDLEKALNFLKNKFGDFKVPTLDMNQKQVIVTEESIPIFSSLLDNKIIVQLLNGEIKIPYYEK